MDWLRSNGVGRRGNRDSVDGKWRGVEGCMGVAGRTVVVYVVGLMVKDLLRW